METKTQGAEPVGPIDCDLGLPGKKAPGRALRHRPTILGLLLCVFALLNLTGCGDGWGEFKPTITTQLGNQTVKVGQTATFKLQATGTGPITYQWSRNNAQISGATATSYSLVAKATDDGAVFSVGATNAGGTSTSAGTLTVLVPPAITTQPVSQSVPAQGTATFKVQATGTAPLTYQWFVNGNPIQGATSTTYVTPVTSVADNGSVFTATATNAVGAATSTPATLTVTPLNAGPSPNPTQPVTTPVAPAISFAVANQTYGVAPFAVSATSNSTGALTYTVASGPATIAGNMLTLTGTGTVTLTANQAADANFTTGSASTTFTVSPESPTLSLKVANQTFGTPPFPVAATSNSTGVITYSVVSGPATIAGNVVTLTGNGAVVLAASQVAAGDFGTGATTATFTVGAEAPTLTFNVPNQTYGTPPFPVNATSNSTGTITYSVVSGPATIAGNVVTLTGSGTVVLSANQAAGNGYSTGTATASFTVGSETTNLNFAVANQTFGTPPFPVNATSNSSGAITYSVVSGPATIAGNTVTLTGSGTVVLSASQAAASGYSAGATTATFAVSAETPTIAFNVPNQTYGAPPFPVNATSNSPGAITYSVVSGPATVAGNVVTLTGSGPVVLAATQAAASGYGTGSATSTFTIGTEAPTLAFSIANQTYGNAPFPVNATSNSTGLITYTVVSGPATIAGNMVTLTGSGPVVISASQAAASGFGTGSTSATFTVGTEVPTLSFNVGNQTLGTPPFPVNATSNSTGTITYAVLSGPASIAGNVVTLTGSGTVQLSASQAAATGFGPGSATATFSVTTKTATLTFTVPNQVYGNPPVALNATASDTGALTYALVSGPATLSGNTLTLTGVGTVSVTANLAATSDTASATATTSFTIAPATPTLTIPAIGNQTYGAIVAVSAISTETGAGTPPITYTVTGPATLAGTTLTTNGVGTVTVTANQAASANYNAPASVSTSFNVTPATPTITVAPITNQNVGATLTVSAISTSTASPITYTVTGPANLVGTTLTVTATGLVTVTANQAASANYTAATAFTQFTIGLKSSTLTIASIPDQVYGGPAIPATASSTSADSPITYTVTGPATIAGNLITTNGVGQVTVTANQAPSAEYAAPASVSTTFNVTPATPTLTVSPIGSQIYGGAAVTINATSTSPGTITYALGAGSPAIIAGNVITTNGTGTVTVIVSQAASANYAAPANVTITFNVTAATPTLTFNHIADVSYGSAAFAVTAVSSETSSTASPIVYTVSGPATGPATISGNTVTPVGTGIVTVTATQAASADYAAITATTTFNVTAATATLTLTHIADQTYGGATVAASATSSETGSTASPIVYTVTGPATIAGNIISTNVTGTVTITATQAASPNYAAVTATTTFNVTAAMPTLTLVPIADQTYGGSAVTATATSDSPGVITYSLGTGSPATISGNAITITGVGTVTVIASQTAATNYSAPANATITFKVTQATPTLTFNHIADVSYGAAAFAVSAISSETNSSASPIVYTVSGPTTGPATISGNMITPVGTGVVTVTATQAASADYVAVSTTATFNVTAATPTLTLTHIADQTYGGATVTASATSSETGSTASPIVYTVSGPATIAGNTITTNATGTITVTATQAASPNYAAVTATTTFNVIAASPTLTLAHIADQTYGGSAVTATATSNSPGVITYSLGTGSPATISGNTITLTGVGTVTVIASQVAATNYSAPANATITFKVTQATPTLTLATIADQISGNTVTPVATSASNGAITYTISTSTAATLSGGVITTNGAGTVTVTASQAATTNYAAPTSVSETFNVALAKPPSITTQPQAQVLCNGGALSLSVTVTGTGPFTYQWFLNGTAISSATSSSYNLGAAKSSDAGSYTVQVTNAVGSVTSAAATVTVGATIVSNPASLSVSAGQTATFAAVATGDVGSFQWYAIGPNATTGTAISGATGPSYTTPAATVAVSGTQFYLAVSDPCGTIVNTKRATLTVTANNFPPVITVQPASVTATVGSKPSFSVTATGSGTLTYQWYVISAATHATTTITSATASTYTLPASSTQTANDQDQYYVIVSNSYGQAVSLQATLAIGAGIQITRQPQNAYVDIGNSATFSVTATSTSALTYQWYAAPSGTSTFTAISGATSSSYTVSAATASQSGEVFYVVVSNGNVTASATSSSAALFVGTLTNIPLCSTGWDTSGTTVPLTVATSTTANACGYQLTAATTYQAGDMSWPALIGTDYLTLSFTVTTSNASSPPADGFAVALGDPSLGATPTRLGATGQGLGVEGIPGLVFAFDDYFNQGDPSVPYVGVTRGEATLFEKPYFLYDTAIPALAVTGDIVTHSYVITLTKGQLAISMDGVQILSGLVNPPPVAYLIITSSTGGYYEQTQITNISASVSSPN